MSNHKYKQYIKHLAKGKEPITDAIALNPRIIADVEKATAKIEEDEKRKQQLPQHRLAGRKLKMYLSSTI